MPLEVIACEKRLNGHLFYSSRLKAQLVDLKCGWIIDILMNLVRSVDFSANFVWSDTISRSGPVRAHVWFCGSCLWSHRSEALKILVLPVAIHLQKRISIFKILVWHLLKFWCSLFAFRGLLKPNCLHLVVWYAANYCFHELLCNIRWNVVK